MSDGTPDLIARLLEALEARPPFALLQVLREEFAAVAQTREVCVWLADYEGERLELLDLGGDTGAQGGTLPIDADGEGTAFRSQRVVVELEGGCACAYVPITVRSERIGVLEVALPGLPAEGFLRQLAPVGQALGYYLLSARRYTDVFERTRRSRELEVPAELQWELLPVLAHSEPDFSIAGRVEPAYDIGGDNFDYAVDPDGITASITDAMGHGVQAAMLSTLAVGVHRNARRRGLGLRQQVRATNTVVHDQFHGDAFVTGLFLRVDRDSGTLMAVNAGHPSAYLLRDDAVTPFVFDADLPMGLFDSADYTTHQTRLEPGDRLLLISDGILEAAPDEGHAFGTARLVDQLRRTAEQPPVEVVRLLTIAVSHHRAGYLMDDATALCLDYRRG